MLKFVNSFERASSRVWSPAWYMECTTTNSERACARLGISGRDTMGEGQLRPHPAFSHRDIY